MVQPENPPNLDHQQEQPETRDIENMFVVSYLRTEK